ncbi:MAG: hypothetical protein V1824_02500 [archaeon]
MGQSKKLLEDNRNDKYVTVKCCICSKKFPKYYSNYDEDIKKSIHTCNECLRDETAHKFK